MKPTLYAVLLTLITGISLSTEAQTTYSITSSYNTSSFGTNICTNCILLLSPGVTITVDNTCTCNTCTFIGGAIVIKAGSNLTLSGVDSFKNMSVIANEAFNMTNLVFYGDTVAFNKTMNLSNGRTSLDSSRVSINANLTVNKGTIYKDSLHVNANLTLTNSTDTFANSNITVATGKTISTNTTNFINSTFAFNGSSSMSVVNGMTSTGNNYYLAGTSAISSSGTTLSGDKIVMNGSTNSFATTNSLSMTNTNLTMSSSTSSSFTANSLTTSGGSITAGAGSSVNITNAINLTNTITTLTNGTFKGNSLSVSGGSFGLANDTATITNADNFSNSTVTMSGTSALTGNSGSLSAGTTMTMSGSATATITNAFNVDASTISLNGNDTVSSNSMSITNGSWFRIGDGSLANKANVSVTNGFNVDNASNMGIANNKNYLQTSNNSLKNNTISCGGGGTQHACTTGYVYGCGTIKNNVGVACIVLAAANINLTATATGPGQVVINFSDEETSQADRYLIQRNTGDNQWNTVNTLNAGGYTAGEYRYTDADAPAGSIEYRIERIDPNGKITYSVIATVSVEQMGIAIGIHPNPATGGLFYITTPNTGEMMVNVFTMTGQLLYRTELKGQTQYGIRLPAQTLSLGSVVVQTISQAGTRTFTVLVR